jgi:hypothetical protein
MGRSEGWRSKKISDLAAGVTFYSLTSTPAVKTMRAFQNGPSGPRRGDVAQSVRARDS